jgi:DNA (cytosine-5)-methyltransferase 1
VAAYYNEIEPYAAQWLRNLIAAGHIAPGDVDERSIEDVCPDDLKPYTQCHFFAGIGVWSHALRLAGWPDDRPVWTGSCPCQPFSAAGKGGGFADERHLWPAFHHLISQRRPPTVFGEQVASKDGLAWLDLVQADLEGSDYATTSVDLCAAGIGAPHIRQRLYWVANAMRDRTRNDAGESLGAQTAPNKKDGDLSGERLRPGFEGSPDGLADADGARSYSGSGRSTATGQRYPVIPNGSVERLADANDTRSQGWNIGRDSAEQWPFGSSRMGSEGASPTNGIWRDADWLFCRDGKWRPVEPRTFPLANGVPNRVGRLRGYGNAIVAPQAAMFIEAFLESK